MSIAQQLEGALVEALKMSGAKVNDRATMSLRKMKLKARNKGDFDSAVISAGYYAKKLGKTMFVYLGDSYGSSVWRVSYKKGEYLNAINNSGRRLMSVSPDLVVKDYQVSGGYGEDVELGETRGDTGPLSKVKKKSAPHMWFIAKAGSGWVVSIGDPHKSSSKTKRTFHNKNELKDWVKWDMADVVSRDHVIDMTGMKLVSPYYSQWYVDNMMKGKK